MGNYTIIGCGDIGLRIAKELIATGQQVQAAVHFEEGVASLQAVGIKTIVANFDYKDDVPEFSIKDQQVFYLMPPQGGGLSDYRMFNFCRILSADNCPSKIVYMSTSGVYGDCGDVEVTEETPVNPQTSRAKRRLSAEQQLRDKAEELGFELVILRVTGIYGPGRLPLSQLMKGHQVLTPAEAPATNRIFSLDLVPICLAAMEKGANGDIFNICDGERSSMSHYFMSVAELYDLPQPVQLSWAEAEKEMNPLTFSFLKESRLMTNKKMVEQLGIKLNYPTLKSGLAACRKTS